MFNATVVRRIDVTPDLVILHVRPDGGVPNFTPGQYVALGLPGSAPRISSAAPEEEEVSPDKLIKRAYSIGSSPDEKGHLEFYLAILPQGSLTSRIGMVKERDRIFCAPKITGTFTLDGIPEGRNLVLISTGTGVAPYMSMIRTKSVMQQGRKITVIHGTRFVRDLAYREELTEMEKTIPGFRYIPTVSREAGDSQVKEGRVTALFDNNHVELNPATDHVFLCGNPDMIDELDVKLKARGYTEHSRKNPGNLHLERYW